MENMVTDKIMEDGAVKHMFLWKMYACIYIIMYVCMHCMCVYCILHGQIKETTAFYFP